MQDSEDMYTIMARILGNEATLTEKITFKTWLAASIDNQFLWEDVQFIWRKKVKTDNDKFDSQKAWQKLAF